jgi:sugar lactone lactonase YvrE
MYVTGGPGKVWKFEKDGTRTTLIDNLNDPKGIATDSYNNLYVVEQGLGRVLKVDTTSGAYEVVLSGLLTPSVVAVDSVNEVYVTQEGANNIIRIRDGSVKSTFSSRPSALSFGVNDILLVGLFDTNIVWWGNQASATVTQPVNIGMANGAKIYRFNQREPANATVVADNLSGVSGFVVDPVGNMYISEAGASRILLSTQAGELFIWSSGVTAPEYMTFTKY